MYYNKVVPQSFFQVVELDRDGVCYDGTFLNSDSVSTLETIVAEIGDYSLQCGQGLICDLIRIRYTVQ